MTQRAESTEETRARIVDAAIALTLALSGGTVTDYSNDTLGSLGPGERGRLDFEHFGEGEGTLSGRITEIDCHDLGFLD